MFRFTSHIFSITSSTATVAAAALVAGLAVFVMPAAPIALAQPVASHLAKVARAVPCILTNWPNYAPRCEFDLRAPSGDTRTVRIIALR